MIKTFFAAALSTALLTSRAEAHGGHLGELAGHSHWIALGAGIAAGAVAVAAAWLKDRRKDDAAGEQDEGPEAAEEAAETAA